MSKKIEYKVNGARLNFHGIITAKEIMNANTELVTHPNFQSFEYQFWILDPVENFIMSAKDLQTVAEQDKMASIIKPKMKVCIVSSSPLAFGIGRMWQAFYGESPWETKVFYNLDEGEEWINS